MVYLIFLSIALSVLFLIYYYLFFIAFIRQNIHSCTIAGNSDKNKFSVKVVDTYSNNEKLILQKISKEKNFYNIYFLYSDEYISIKYLQKEVDVSNDFYQKMSLSFVNRNRLFSLLPNKPLCFVKSKLWSKRSWLLIFCTTDNNNFQETTRNIIEALANHTNIIIVNMHNENEKNFVVITSKVNAIYREYSFNKIKKIDFYFNMLDQLYNTY